MRQRSCGTIVAYAIVFCHQEVSANAKASPSYSALAKVLDVTAAEEGGEIPNTSFISYRYSIFIFIYIVSSSVENGPYSLTLAKHREITASSSAPGLRAYDDASSPKPEVLFALGS